MRTCEWCGVNIDHMYAQAMCCCKTHATYVRRMRKANERGEATKTSPKERMEHSLDNPILRWGLGLQSKEI